MCWRLRTTAERSTLRICLESGWDMCTISWIPSRKAVGVCQPTCVLSSDMTHSFIADNLCEGDTNRKYEFKRVRQTKLIPTSECYGLEVLESVNTSVSRTSRDDVLPEDLWPNFNATVTKLQERYIGSHEEMLVAQQHGFDRDFLACSSNAPVVVLYRVHVKPRSTMFDPNQCATSPLPACVQILSRQTFLKDTRATIAVNRSRTSQSPSVTTIISAVCSIWKTSRITDATISGITVTGCC